MSRAALTASQQMSGTPKNTNRNRNSINRRGSLQRSDELGNGLPDGVGRVFLQEMQAGDSDLRLVRPAPAEVPWRADQNRSRFGVDEELRGRIVGAEPLAVRNHVGHH